MRPGNGRGALVSLVLLSCGAPEAPDHGLDEPLGATAQRSVYGIPCPNDGAWAPADAGESIRIVLQNAAADHCLQFIPGYGGVASFCAYMNPFQQWIIKRPPADGSFADIPRGSKCLTSFTPVAGTVPDVVPCGANREELESKGQTWEMESAGARGWIVRRTGDSGLYLQAYPGHSVVMMPGDGTAGQRWQPLELPCAPGLERCGAPPPTIVGPSPLACRHSFRDIGPVALLLSWRDTR